MPNNKIVTKKIRIPLEIICGEKTCGKCMFIGKLSDPQRISCRLFDTLLNFKPEWGDIGEIDRCNECLDIGRNIDGIVLESAGVGEGHPKDKCSFCGKKLPNEDDRTATCTMYEYVTLCKECYRKAGTSVR